jgi:hypothetical protein
VPTSDPPPRPGDHDPGQLPLRPGPEDPGQVPLRPGRDAGQRSPRPGSDAGQVPLRPGRDPGGRVAYLPPRAARARKLILRTQLGRGWILASALFGVVILAAGVLFLARGGHPGPPWVRVAAITALPVGTVTQVAGPAGQAVVVDRRDGLRAFLGPAGPCPVRAAGDGFARRCTGQRWDASGAPAGGGGSAGSATPPLRRVPAVVSGGALYVDPH